MAATLREALIGLFRHSFLDADGAKPFHLFDEFTVVYFVFDAEGFSFSAGFPVFLRDDALSLREAFGRQRVRTEISKC